MSNLITRDLKHLWHPCSQMKDYENFLPLIIRKAQGPYLELEDGCQLIDAISSWWCKSLGHNHPFLKKALLAQIEKFEHVILANTTHETIVHLSEQLSRLTQTLDKVFYAGDGSCAVEIAMKMSLHARKILGEKNRTHFIALSNSYHGETVGALSMSDLGLYRAPYQSLCFDVDFIQNIPYVSGTQDPLWKDCSEHWLLIEKQLAPLASKTTALFVEPIVQGAGGMLIYSQDLLCRLRKWCDAHNIHLIADEIMTGIGRTGKMLACEHANIEPDFVCLSKGLTSGWLPLSAVLTSEKIYQLFYDDYSTGKAFLHSHTYTGNALAVSVASACLQFMEEQKICDQVQKRFSFMQKLMEKTAEKTGRLKNIRGIGGIVAADLVVKNTELRCGYAVYQEAVKRGALLRPLGNTIYWLPPLNIEESVLYDLQRITEEAILASLP